MVQNTTSSSESGENPELCRNGKEQAQELLKSGRKKIFSNCAGVRTSIRILLSGHAPQSRSFLYQERHRSLATPDMQPRFSRREIFRENAAMSLQGKIEKPIQQLRQVFSGEARHLVRSAHQNWDNTSFCRSMSSEAGYTYTAEQVVSNLKPNFDTFTDEYCLGTIKKSYRYAALHDEDGEAIGTSGVDDSYRETMATGAKRFQDRLAKLGRRHQRAEVETHNSSRLDAWVARACRDETVPLGSKLVWFSPPGHQIEGYQGISRLNHSFVWVYEVKEDARGRYVEMTQFRCWPTLHQLQETQTQILRAGVPLTGSFNNATLTHRNAIISTMVEVDPSVTVQDIETEIFASGKNWRVKRKDIHEQKLTKQQRADFDRQRTEVLNYFLRPIYQELLGTDHIKAQLRKPYKDQFWTSNEYRELIAKLDAAFGFSSQILSGWIELRLKKSKKYPEVPIDKLWDMYSTYLDYKNGTASPEQLRSYGQAASVLLSTGNRLLSVGQCGLGTIIPTNLAKSIFDSINMPNIQHMTDLRGKDLEKLTIYQKTEFRKALQEYKHFDVYDLDGQVHRFWVHEEHHEFYATQSYVDQQGILRGPCHIPLNMKRDKLIYTDERYQELLEETHRNRQSDHDALTKLNAKEALALAQSKSEAEKQRIRQYFADLRDSMTKKVGDIFLTIGTLGMSNLNNAPA